MKQRNSMIIAASSVGPAAAAGTRPARAGPLTRSRLAGSTPPEPGRRAAVPPRPGSESVAWSQSRYYRVRLTVTASGRRPLTRSLARTRRPDLRHLEICGGPPDISLDISTYTQDNPRYPMLYYKSTCPEIMMMSFWPKLETSTLKTSPSHDLRLWISRTHDIRVFLPKRYPVISRDTQASIP
jgi:hypothetical protein